MPNGIEAAFFVGQGDEPCESEVMELCSEDTYQSLPFKIQSFLRRLLDDPQWDYVFKCDDDTYVCLDRLPLLTSQGEFVGSADTVKDGFASGGGGYLLSRDCAKLVAAAPDVGVGREDVWVSNLLIHAGKSLVPSTALRMDAREVPTLLNELVTCHWCSPEQIAAIHAGLSGEALCTFAASHSAWTGSVALYRNGLFLGGGSKPNGRWEINEKNDTLLLKWFDWAVDTLHKTSNGYSSAQLQLVGRIPYSSQILAIPT